MIKIIEFHKSENIPFKEQASKEGILFSANTTMFKAVLNNEVIGICGILIRKKSAVLKCAYIKKAYRGKSLLKKLIEHRINFIKYNYKEIDLVSANVTRMALNSHLRCGAKIKEVFKNGITKVQYENIS